MSESIQTEDIIQHNKNIVQAPVFTKHSIKQYFGSRFSSLFVPKEELAQYTWNDIFNPFQHLKEVNRRQWNYFMLNFFCWIWDAVDFFTTSLNLPHIAKDLDKSIHALTWGITLALMFRSVGAFIFGGWADTQGRKYPLITNLLLLIAIQLGTGFVKTYSEFIATRALFGIAMGGLYGLCAADALGDLPKNSAGIMSGIFQEGYAIGYLLAVIFQRAIADTTSGGWRNMYFFSAAVPTIFIVWRILLPESESFRKQKARFEEEARNRGTSKFVQFKADAKKALRKYWLMIIYMILMMSGFNFLSHGSQDLVNTMLTNQYGFGKNRSTVTNVVANLGAIVGGMVFGHFSQFIGRRLAIIIACLVGGAFIYPWAFVSSGLINLGMFFVQFGVQGAWGVVPIHINELAPPQYRAFICGLTYQLGNLASSASSTIEATIAERFPIVSPKGLHTYNYSKTMAIFIACVFVYVMIIVFLGPEYRGASLTVDRDDVASKYSIHLDNDDEADKHSKHLDNDDEADKHSKHLDSEKAMSIHVEQRV